MLLNRNCPSGNTNGTLKFTVGGLICPKTKIGYIPYVTSYNNPKISKRMLYSQYVNAGRNNGNILFINALAATNAGDNNNNIYSNGNYSYSTTFYTNANCAAIK